MLEHRAQFDPRAILQGWSDFPPADFQAGVACVGNFDGVHQGHAALIASARALVSTGPVVAVTFSRHPVHLLAPERARPALTTIPDRVASLLAIGADRVWVLDTQPDLLALSADSFVEEVLFRRLQVQGVAEGADFRFGRAREGDTAVLREMCTLTQRRFTIAPMREVAGGIVSSSRIRTALESGDVSTANMLLGRPYRLRGIVGTGAQRGRTIGFPTANLSEPQTLVPALGVYAAIAEVPAGRFRTAVHLGPNPTFGEDARKIEAHLLDFTGNLYDQPIALEFRQRLRDVRKFSGPDELVQQLRTDVSQARSILEKP